MRTNLAKAVRRSLILELLDHGQIQTRKALAKSVQGDMDKVVNLLRENSINAKRQLVKMLGQEVKTNRTFSDRKSGYTRIIKLGQRFSDTTEMVIMEFVDKMEAKVVEPVKVKEEKVVEAKVEEPKKIVRKTTKKNAKSN